MPWLEIVRKLEETLGRNVVNNGKHIGGCIHGGTPKWMVYKGKSNQHGWFGGTAFQETTIWICLKTIYHGDSCENMIEVSYDSWGVQFPHNPYYPIFRWQTNVKICDKHGHLGVSIYNNLVWAILERKPLFSSCIGMSVLVFCLSSNCWTSRYSCIFCL